jgi:hypothetical protein
MENIFGVAERVAGHSHTCACCRESKSLASAVNLLGNTVRDIQYLANRREFSDIEAMAKNILDCLRTEVV